MKIEKLIQRWKQKNGHDKLADLAAGMCREVGCLEEVVDLYYFQVVWPQLRDIRKWSRLRKFTFNNPFGKQGVHINGSLLVIGEWIVDGQEIRGLVNPVEFVTVVGQVWAEFEAVNSR